MKPQSRTMNVTSTLVGEKVGMSIDESALAHIMSVLTDLYSDPEMAVVREYATNAYDAHVEAGVSLPIEVTLPMNLSPYLKIRDYGAGLDIEDIRTIYSRYGTSTKRETNDLVGTLGLGCKSALTYTNQFTLQGIKNGTCTQVSISRDADGAGSMTIVAEFPTTDASGVEITIPVNSHNNFAEKARYLFQFWDDDTVLVNGEPPVQLTGLEIDSDIFIVAAGDLDESVIVMGNVPYPMGVDYGFRAIARVPMGAVQFTPSREALQMTAETKRVIEDIKERVQVGKQAAVERLIADATSKHDALTKGLDAASLFSYRGELTYKKDVLPNAITASADEPIWSINRFRRGYGRSQEKLEYNAPIGYTQNAIFLTGYTNKTFSGWARQKLEQWIESEVENISDLQVQHFILCETLPASVAEWIDPRRVYDYALVAAQKIRRETTRQDGRAAGAYRVSMDGTYVYATPDEIDSSRPIFYYSDYYSTEQSIVREAYPKALIVEQLAANREAKFLRLFPNAKHVRDAAKEVAQRWADKLTPAQVMHLTLDYSDCSVYTLLDATRIDDPALRATIDLCKKSTGSDALRKRYEEYQYLCTLPESVWVNPSGQYPGLDGFISTLWYERNDSMSARLLDHLYLYVNAVYAAEKEKI